MANEIPKNHSEASRGVLKSGCTIYNCINTAVGACSTVVCIQYAAALCGAWGGGGQRPFVISSDFFGISLPHS